MVSMPKITRKSQRKCVGNFSSYRRFVIKIFLSRVPRYLIYTRMAAHESPRTTKLYDRTKERLTQDEVERIRL
jgi:hypothetical protein